MVGFFSLIYMKFWKARVAFDLFAANASFLIKPLQCKPLLLTLVFFRQASSSQQTLTAEFSNRSLRKSQNFLQNSQLIFE
jgi:hypothetical protein